MQDNSNKFDCPDKGILGEYASGQLVEPQLGQCEAHLAECDRCEETIRGMVIEDTANDSFGQLAKAALCDAGDAGDSAHVSSSDAPLVDRLIRDLVDQVPSNDPVARAIENRAAEVKCLLPPSENPDSIGRVGGYEIEYLLGAGSTGIVYAATDNDLNRKVALKILRPSLGEAARDRFMNEARAAAAISHPNVITIYQVGSDGPLAFIAMELTEGQTLESRLNEVAFVPEGEVQRIATQVAQGLVAAHRNGLIHRDIKPANVWLKAEEGQAVILDFGLARIADDDPQMTATGMLAGTPNFMSPEQTRGLELDGRSDLFSLGCLMYRSATGKLPFGSTGILATLQSIQNDEPRAPKLLNPHLTDDFSDLVMALLEKQPANRPDGVEQLVKALRSERSQWPFSVASYSPTGSDTTSNTNTARLQRTSPASGWGARNWVTAGLLLIGLGATGWFCVPQIIRIATDQGQLVIDAQDEAVEIEVLKGGELVRVIDTKTDQIIDIESGEYRVQLKDERNGIRLSTDRVSLTRGGQEIVSIEKVNSSQPIGNLPVGPTPAVVATPIPKGSGRTRSSAGSSFTAPVLAIKPESKGLGRSELYAGRSFDQWMSVVKNDRQLKTKFDALTAVVELAQGDAGLKKQVMAQIKPLLRKYGSKRIRNEDPFHASNGAVKRTNTIFNSQLTLMFVGLLGIFSPDDLVELAIDEIKHGTANSREFVTLIWSFQLKNRNGPDARSQQIRLIQQRAPEIVSTVLETSPGCDAEAQIALMETISMVSVMAGMESKPLEDLTNTLYRYQDPSEDVPPLKLPAGIEKLLVDAFESTQPMQQALVAVPMARAFPDRPNLAKDLASLLANENARPEFRLVGLGALEQLPLDKIQAAEDQLLSVGLQSETAKKQLGSLPSSLVWRPFNRYGVRLSNGSVLMNIDMRIVNLLSRLSQPSEESRAWMNQLNDKTQTTKQDRRSGRFLDAEKNFFKQAVERFAGDQVPGSGFGDTPPVTNAPVTTAPEPKEAGRAERYADRTFDQWMEVVKTDRQMKTKFEALGASAELAQGDEERKQQVMDQVRPLLRKYGARSMEGGNPFGHGLEASQNEGTVKNSFRKSELTHLFIEVLRRFPADDLMQLAIDEIKHGTANSREFVIWCWIPSSWHKDDPVMQMKHIRAMERHAIEIASAVLETVESSDQESRVAMIGTIAGVGGAVGLELNLGQDPLTELRNSKKRNWTGEVATKWTGLVTEAFESKQPIRQAIVANAVAYEFPDRPNLAKDLVALLANEEIEPEFRYAGLLALESLPVQSVQDELLSVGKQSGPAKERLIKLSSQQQGFRKYSNDVNMRIANVLSRLDEPSAELLPWLKELMPTVDVKSGAGVFEAQFLGDAIRRVKGEPPEVHGGGRGR